MLRHCSRHAKLATAAGMRVLCACQALQRPLSTAAKPHRVRESGTHFL